MFKVFLDRNGTWVCIMLMWRGTEKVKFLVNPQQTCAGAAGLYLLVITPKNVHISFISNLIMSNVLAGKEKKSRWNNVFLAYSINIYDSLLTFLWKPDGYRWVYVLGWCGPHPGVAVHWNLAKCPQRYLGKMGTGN